MTRRKWAGAAVALVVVGVCAVVALPGADHPAHALPFAGAWIVDDIAFFDLTAVNSEENQLAHVGVSPQLECQRAELAAIIGGYTDFVVGAGLDTLRRRNVERPPRASSSSIRVSAISRSRRFGSLSSARRRSR